MDKNKIIEAAGKLVAKGAYDKAIKEYQKILEVDPKDVRILQKMGDLYQKKNDNAQAAHYFTKVAESYSADGFFLKAVALYKQVLKLNPTLMDVNMRLGDLHQQLQLMGEAMTYYQVVANHYDKVGDVRSSLDMLKRMVELDPDNIASRIKLADLYARETMAREAGAEYKRAAEYLKRNSRHDDYLKVAERIAALEPNDLELARELAEGYLQRQDFKRALAKLQVCFKADPRDEGTLRLLATAFEGLGQTAKTISVFKELGKVYAEKGRADDVAQVWRQVEKLDPQDPDLLAQRAAQRPPRREEPSSRVVASPPPSRPAEPAPAAPRPSPVAPTRGPSSAPPATAPVAGDQLAKLLTETDVYVKYGLHEKALEHLRRVFTVEPENLEAHEKAYEIYVASGNAGQAAEQLLNVLRLCARANDVERARPYLETILRDSPDHPEVPTFLSILGVESPAAEEAEEAILVDAAEEEVVVSEAPDDALAQTDDMALAHSAAAVSEEIVEDEQVFESEEPEHYDIEPVPTDEVDEPIVADAEDLPAAGSELDPAPSDVGSEVLVEADGEFAAVEVSQDPPTLSGQVPPTASETYASHDDGVPAVVEPAEYLDEAEMDTSPPGSPVHEEPVELPPDDEPASEECDEAGFFVDQGLFDEAREILETVLIAFPGHRRASELLARIDAGAVDAPATTEEAPAPPKAEGDVFDLASALADELVSDDAGRVEPSADDFQYSVEEVFSEFKKGLQKVVKPGDVDTHYDLGIAYKEMGLLDDAITEFEVARQGCVGQKKEVDCLTMVGLLCREKGDHGGAVEAFRRALASEHAVPDVEKALRYELGLACEANGSPGKALFHFQRVARLDAGYRDVGQIAARLSAVARPEEDLLPSARDGLAQETVERVSAPSATKARKVGYV